MKEATLVCQREPYGCGTVVGNAYCPNDGSQLEYKGRTRAQCPKCGETWAPVNLKRTCPRGHWDLRFSY